MGTAIYSASPFQAFLGSLTTILALFGIGVTGIGFALIRRNQKTGTRILTGSLGILLILVGCVFAAVTFVSGSSGAQSMTVRLTDKTIATDNCGENGETCTRYVLEATTSTNAFDFDVPQEAYDKAQVDTCYQFTYFPNKGLFGNSGSYQRIDAIARIEIADPASCQ